MNIFIDDERYPKQVKWVNLPMVDWVVVRSYNEFINLVKKEGLPKRVSFDHDLAFEHYPCAEPDGGIGNPTKIPYDKYEEKTGYHCAKWLVDYCIKYRQPFPEYYVHSMNPIGSKNIISYIEGYKLHCERK